MNLNKLTEKAQEAVVEAQRLAVRELPALSRPSQTHKARPNGMDCGIVHQEGVSAHRSEHAPLVIHHVRSEVDSQLTITDRKRGDL